MTEIFVSVVATVGFGWDWDPPFWRNIPKRGIFSVVFFGQGNQAIGL